LVEPEWTKNGIQDFARAEHYLDEFAFSSYLDYSGTDRPQGTIVERTALPQYFETPDALKKCTLECLRFPRKLSRSNLDSF